jgi:hypothetical protein
VPEACELHTQAKLNSPTTQTNHNRQTIQGLDCCLTSSEGCCTNYTERALAFLANALSLLLLLLRLLLWLRIRLLRRCLPWLLLLLVGCCGHVCCYCCHINLSFNDCCICCLCLWTVGDRAAVICTGNLQGTLCNRQHGEDVTGLSRFFGT